MTPVRPHARRRPRLDLVALLVTVVCVVVAGWAVRGLLTDPVPGLQDFGAASTTSDPVVATAPAEVGAGTVGTGGSPSPDAGPAPEEAPDPVAPTVEAARGAVPTPPGRRSASLADQPAPAPAPVRLRVPSVGLDVPLDAVGVAPDGQMEVPEDADRAGWYRHGPAPGSGSGSAVVAGHVDDRSGPGAFLALTEAQEGAQVVVDLEDGTSATYRVVGRQTVAKPELAVDDLFARSGPPTLRLVTCTGEWSRQTGHYTDNLVLTAEPVG